MTGEQRQGQWTTALHSVYVVGSGPALFLPTAPHCTFAAQGAKGPLFFGESSHWLLEPHTSHGWGRVYHSKMDF